MQNDTIIFQLATHFLPKIALRLENLLLTIQEAALETHPIIHHYALKNIIEIIKLIEKPELKSRFLKEFIRIEHALNKSQTPISNELYASLFIQIQHLNYVAGRFGEALDHDPFLQSIRLNQAISQNDFEVHSPQLILWLENQSSKRQQDLCDWMKPLQPLSQTVAVYLSLLRDTAAFDKIHTLNGYYQCSLPSKSLCHLILLKMEKNSGIVPKMQLGHHGLSVRFCEIHSMNEIRPADAHIELAICQL